jgi:hypothetical protein
VSYVLAGDGSVGFTVGQYNAAHEMTIDPILTFGTYLGSSASDWAAGVAADNSQNIYVTGYTYSTNFPHENGYDQTFNGDADAFVTKYQNGTRVYSTFLGGSSFDNGNGIAVDSTSKVYIAGHTESIAFPTKNPYDATYNGGAGDVFVIKLDPSISGVNSLLYGTY